MVDLNHAATMWSQPTEVLALDLMALAITVAWDFDRFDAALGHLDDTEFIFHQVFTSFPIMVETLGWDGLKEGIGPHMFTWEVITA